MANIKQMVRALATSTISPFRLATGPLRALPDFLIIGAQRSGSSSLHAYVTSHPRIRGAIRKEVHFFDLQYRLGADYYRAHFPLRARLGADRPRILVGEATPYYLANPLVLDRAHALLPDARIIAILRNPVERAISQWNANVVRRFERLSLPEALAAEESRLAHEIERMLADPTYYSWLHRRYSYKARGRYAEQLAPWIERYGEASVLVLQSERLFESPAATCARVFSFLGVEDHPIGDFARHRAVPYETDVDPAVRAQLSAYYRQPNEELYALVGERFDWD